MITPETQTRRDAQQAARVAREAGERIDHALHVFENLLRPLKRRLAVARDAHAPRGPQEELHAEARFQHRDALADVDGEMPISVEAAMKLERRATMQNS